MKSVRHGAAVLLLFIALSFAHTWPLVTQLTQQFAGSYETLLHTWELNQMARQLTKDPLHPLQGNTFYPYPDTLAALDHVCAGAILVLPLRLAGVPPMAVYNAYLLSTFVFSGCCMWLLVARLSGSSAGGLIAGSAFAFSTIRWTHLSHLHMLSSQWIPLALLLLHAFLEEPTWKRLAWFTAACVAVVWSSWHIAMIAAVGIGLVALWTLATDTRPVSRRLVQLTLTAIVVVTALLPFIGPYRRMSADWSAPGLTPVKQTAIQDRNSLQVEGLLAPSEWAKSPHVRWLARFGALESRGSPGLVVAILCAIAVGWLVLPIRGANAPSWALLLAVAGAGVSLILLVGAAAAGYQVDIVARYSPVSWLSFGVLVALLLHTRLIASRNGRDATLIVYLSLAIAGTVLAFGPSVTAWGHNLGRGFYRGDLVAPLLLIRAPARFVTLTMLGTAVVAGLTFARIQERLSARLGLVIAALAIAAVNADAFVAPLGLTALPVQPASHRWLAQNHEAGAVFEYPRRDGGPLLAVYGSLFHSHPIINGIGYYAPRFVGRPGQYPDLSRQQLEFLWEYRHPRFVVVHRGLYPPEEGQAVLERIASQPDALRVRATFPDEFVYELFDRGAGPSLVRRWPDRILERSNRVELTGSVTNVPAGKTGLLMADFNNVPVLIAAGAAVASPARYDVPLARGRVQRGENVLVVRGDYRFAADAQRNAIGSTGASIAADVRVNSTPAIGTIQVNGRVVPVEKGYTLVALDPESGAIRQTGNFNTSWSSADAAALVTFVRGLAPGTPVLVASEFDVSRRLTASAVAALREVGLAGDLRDRFQWSHAGIGVKGAAPGTALEMFNARAATVTLGRPASPRVVLQDLRLIERDK